MNPEWKDMTYVEVSESVLTCAEPILSQLLSWLASTARGLRADILRY